MDDVSYMMQVIYQPMNIKIFKTLRCHVKYTPKPFRYQTSVFVCRIQSAEPEFKNLPMKLVAI